MEKGRADEVDGIIMVDSRQSVGKREKYAFARNEKKGARLLRIKPVEEVGSEDLLAANGDFMPLSKPKRRRRSDSDSSMEGDYEKKHFQLIEMPAGPEIKPEGQNLEYATESDSEAEGRSIKIDEATRQEHVELSRQVDRDPTNLEAWLALINHQDAMLGLGKFEHRKITTAEIQSTAEIKISMYQKALQAEAAGESLQNRERILLGMMKEGAKVWSRSKQAKIWEEVTTKEVASLKLWTSYINFRMSDFQDFTYDDVKRLFQDRLALLTVAKEKTFEKHGAENNDTGKLDVLHHQLVYTLLRATIFMRELGYTELSVAIWQAVLEYNIPHGRSFEPERKNNFDEFWESEVPRIGEEGAKGWRDFTEIEMEPPPVVRMDSEIPPTCTKTSDVLSGWASAERFREVTSRWPAKTCDETVEDDPYRVILWSDVQNYLIDVGFTTSGGCWKISYGSHRMLVDAFLVFCRLPPLTAAIRFEWPSDPFIFDNILESAVDYVKRYLNKSSEDEELLDPLNAGRKDADNLKTSKNIFDTPAQNIVFTTDTLFSSPGWASYLSQWSAVYSSASTAGPLDIYFVRRSLETLTRTYPTDELGEYYLAWTFLHQPTEIQKVAQNLIANLPQSRRLYNAYALLLWNSGKKEKAVGVWNKVLGMPDLPNKIEKANEILLWKSRVWCHLDDGDSATALKCLLSIGTENSTTVEDVETKSSVLLMRAKQHLASSRDFLLSSEIGWPAKATLTAEFLSLLYYLAPSDSSIGRDVEGALGVVDHFVASLQQYKPPSTIHHEAILQFSARLLWHHVRTGPFRPALTRFRMEEALQVFPQNTIFLSLYAWNESRARIDDRVRAMLRDNELLPENDCITSRLFAIRYEIQRGNVYSVKAAFEHAVASEACKGNAGLWRLYVLWCAQSDDEKIKKQAKEVLYRGMRACPGVKALMMEAFETLRPLMKDEEVKSVHKVMEEKEVRIHVDLEDWLEEHGGDDD